MSNAWPFAWRGGDWAIKKSLADGVESSIPLIIPY
jgi:hypothetical protein